METWQLTKRDLKKYPHFDPLLSVEKAMALAMDAAEIAIHKFYPFMVYKQRWNRFSKLGETGEVKERPIRYAARSDSYIFSYYRSILSCRYEAELTRLGLSDSVLAYRRIPKKSGSGGKCNIDFAHDAVLRVRELGDCCAIALDIKGYFESLDHERIYTLWCRLLGVDKLSPDHNSVFKAVTQYSVVDKQLAYGRLGHFGVKRRTRSGIPIDGYLTPYNKIPKQLCTGREFRDKIGGGNGQKTLIKKNHKLYGIPQGAPISDLLANLYLIDFDQVVCEWARMIGGSYYRYSDDILIVVPGADAQGLAFADRVGDLIRQFGKHLRVKDNKSSIFSLCRVEGHQKIALIRGDKGKNGLEYLGFRYDGRQIYIRDATIANLLRKVSRVACREANVLARRYPDKGTSQLKVLFNYEQLIKKFGKVEDFHEKQEGFESWTFWTYARRASDVFGPLGRRTLRQLRNYRRGVRLRADAEIEKAVVRREKKKMVDENL